MLLNPTSHMAAMEANTCASAGEVGLPDVVPPSRRPNLVTEYSDVFEPPGMPVEREIDHKIELEPGATPPYRHQYRVSAAEVAEVRRQLGEYLEKGWIHPSSSPYGTPIVFIRKKTGKLRMTVTTGH